MKTLLDMNLPPRWAELLTKKGIESLHWHKIGAPDADDMEIMAYAYSNDYIVLTCDLDFSAILSATHGLKPSVVQIRAMCFQEETVDLLADVLIQSASELEKGAILVVDFKKNRLRSLPL